MPTIRQSVAAGSQFTGLTGAGLIVLTGLPNEDMHEYILKGFTVTTPDEGTITTGVIELVDLEEGYLNYDNQTVAEDGDATLNGDGDGDADADIVSHDETNDIIHLQNIVGTFEDNDVLTGDVQFVADAVGGVEFIRKPIDDMDSADLADGHFSLDWGEGEEGYGVPKNANKTSYAFRFTSTGLDRGATIQLDFGYRRIRQ